MNKIFNIITVDSQYIVIDTVRKKAVARPTSNIQVAKKTNRFLNNGGAFNGHIPEYMFNGWRNRPVV